MDLTMSEVKDFQGIPASSDPIWMRFLKGLATVAILIILGIIASLLGGILLGANETVNLGQVSLNPNATATFLLIAYFSGKLYGLKPMQTYRLLILGGILSVVMAFVPGILLMLFTVPTLKKLNLV